MILDRTIEAGTVVKAKRAGWDIPEEGEVTEQDIQYPPPWREDGEDEEMQGPIEYIDVEPDGADPYTVVLVNGHEVDPETIEVWDATFNSFCPTGPGGGIDNTCSPNEKAAGTALYAAPLGMSVGAVSRKLKISKEDAKKALDDLVEKGIVRLNPGVGTYSYIPSNRRQPTPAEKPKAKAPPPPLGHGEKFRINDQYEAKVVSVDKPSETLGGEKATTIYYVHTPTGKTAGQAILMKDDVGYVLGGHELNAEHRGKGLGRQFIPLLSKRVGQITSDAAHTEDAERMWKSLPGAKQSGPVWVITG